MRLRFKLYLLTFTIATPLCCGLSYAQAPAGTQATSPMKSQTPPRNTAQMPDAPPDTAKAPNPGEEKALKDFKKFQAMPNDDLAKKEGAGEDFLKKYPKSVYAQPVYSFLTVAYIQTGQVDKGLADGESDLQLNPTDYRTMSVMSQTIARTVVDNAPDTAAKLEKAETLAKNAITGATSWAKPEGITDANFATMKNDTLTMGHASLGLVAIHRGNFEAAIPDLQQAVELGGNTDPTNYYLLGLANLNSGHHDKAAEAFDKCAAIKGTNLTSTCVSLSDQAKKDASQAKPK
jgi:tetratricopeptide (TPR) repeat protein